ncbi:M14 family zinc carboxypeptidase [Snuella sedimenti]|uniref:Peptidase M14 n=1 Tax=Snuella sedimenti TaxID=2798802 RepID=A0A8J7IWX5_9FLAO|nr:M14 family zinc carboxypeptidase [Snuella sedimenti]MBJ6368650.1 peptidase M14 [Snuella sedimenti]
MKVEEIKSLFLTHKEHRLKHRYITNNHIAPLLNDLKEHIVIETIGTSVLKDDIEALKIGSGDKKILMWSQMHGNESTTTKALFDLINTLIDTSHLSYILEACTLYIIPILNPDGAKAYTRVNANSVDLNRDAQLLSQPESLVLKQAFEAFKPHFCYNLHGQRTIFSAGKTNKPATVSFLAPAQDKECTVTANRKVAMEVISVMNSTLQQVIPNQVGVYDDAFNLNCVGDTFQSKNVPTILFEAGHFHNDYGREYTRECIYISLLSSLDYIARHNVNGSAYKPYFEIPENEKCFLDIVIRNVNLGTDVAGNIGDVGVLFQECLIDGKIEFIPKIESIGNLDGLFGHKELNANRLQVFGTDGKPLKIEDENVFVIMNNEKISLLLE